MNNNPSNPQDEDFVLFDKLYVQLYDDVEEAIRYALCAVVTRMPVRFLDRHVEDIAREETIHRVQYELDNYDPTLAANPGSSFDDYPGDDDAYFDNN